jgi:hypothetical protein
MHDLQEECYYTIDRLGHEIKEADYEVEIIQEELDEKVPLRNRRQATLKEKEELKVGIQEEIIELFHTKEAKDADWDQIQEDHSRATYVIQTAKDVLQGSLVAFVQSGTNIMAQLSQHFSQSSKKIEFHKQKSWNQVFRILAEITSATPVQADQGQMAKIIELCDNLLKKINESLDLERRQY